MDQPAEAAKRDGYHWPAPQIPLTLGEGVRYFLASCTQASCGRWLSAVFCNWL